MCTAQGLSHCFTSVLYIHKWCYHSVPATSSGSLTFSCSSFQASYDMELQALHEMIQQKVVTLLSDPVNIVKRTLLETGITRLCVFFGRQKASDVLLSHMITFLNDKVDRCLLLLETFYIDSH